MFATGMHFGAMAPKSALADLQAQDWESKYQASQIALSTVQGQLKQAQVVSANNSKAIQDLNDENAKITADRGASMLLAQRLLNAAKTLPASSPVVSQTSGGQPTIGAGDTASLSEIEGMVVNSSDECEQTANQLNALIAQLKPQL